MEALSLSELTSLIKESIDLSFPEYYFIIAEISQINVNFSGHAYIQLVEKDEDTDNIAANLRAVIWANKYNLISAYFESVTGSGLNAGMKILIKAEVSFHNVYGLSLVIHDIDPTYTLGDIEKQRQKIIAQIKEDGIFDMNKNLDFPIVPQRIAIISSPTAAGLDDFINQLNSNKYNFNFEHRLFKATMQGEKTEKSIISTLDKIFKINEKFDLVAIIRGGGSKLDLSAFDSYNIAANIAQFPLPILTGIGHQRDMSIADLVSHKSLKTPTAVADFIIQKTLNFENLLNSYFENIQNLILSHINEETYKLTIKKSQFNNIIFNSLVSSDSKLKMLNEKLKTKSIFFLLKKEELLRQSISNCKASAINNLKDQEYKNKILKNNIIENTKTFFREKSVELQIINTKLKAHNPEHILNLGFSITYKNNKIIKSKEELQKGNKIKSRFKDGNIESEVL